MRNIEKTFIFLKKNWAITIPAIIGCVIANVIVGILELLNIISLDKELDKLNQQFQNLQSFSSINIASLIPIYVVIVTISVISTVLAFMYFPIIAGLVHESLRSNKILNIRELLIASKEAFAHNIKKYFKFFAANFLIWIIFYIILFIILFAIILVSTGIIAVGNTVITLISLLAFVLIIVIFSLAIVYFAFTSMWFQSIIVDEFKTFYALKICFGIIKRRFWYVMGMFLLISILTFFVNVFGIVFASGFRMIPLFEGIVTGCVAGIITVFEFVFYMYMYYENRPNLELINTHQIEKITRG